MDATLKAKWVEALRSGEYEQSEQFLKSPDNKFCCLGVLLKVQGVDIDNLYAGQSLVTTHLPPEFSAGLTSEERNDLANRNDGAAAYYAKRMSFPEIADHIEQEL